jgi:hypothetical protein
MFKAQREFIVGHGGVRPVRNSRAARNCGPALSSGGHGQGSTSIGTIPFRYPAAALTRSSAEKYGTWGIF